MSCVCSRKRFFGTGGQATGPDRLGMIVFTGRSGGPMSFNPRAVIASRALPWALCALEKRWVRALLFAATFLAAWLHKVPIAHAAGI